MTRRTSPSILAGVIFDDRGNPMSPSHANKKGVRYRYYVSHALLQNCKADAGSVPRVSAPDVEILACEALRKKLIADRADASAAAAADATSPINNPPLIGPAFNHAFIVDHVEHVIVHRSDIEIVPRISKSEAPDTEASSNASSAIALKIPFEPHLPLKKGIAHAPAGTAVLDPRSRETLLQAIALAHQWMDQILTGKAMSFEAIAATENLAERYVQRLAVLAYLSPKIIRAIVDGTAPGDLTVSSLTQALPHSWSAQEQMLNLR
jgi:hypothetical protein